ncbi:hypothetical protein [Pelomonas sp. SE-A7]|uniref:hypothetical protein n=1 Tax=Pelomonas sp. SE-A7 TaxID=3054953 RepID=UPI00259CE4D4|nr:hypothetical protein [Pelomonas sp. SE-A7]MDM4768077.1 hypothetical protein [Pelomonas sp. SE-A7]
MTKTKLKRRALLTALVMLPLVAQAAEPPQVMLQIELRWVETSLSGAALDASKRGAVVVGTGGSVSPAGGKIISTRPADAGVSPVQRLLVLNGRQASALVNQPRRMEMLDWGVERDRRGQWQPQAQMRSVWVDRQTGFQIKPSWPGGSQPVLLELRALLPRGEAGSEELVTTQLIPLDQWAVVAREGSNPQAPAAGTYSSRDAEPQTSRELQLRIVRAP